MAVSLHDGSPLPMVGRSRELAAIRGSLDRAADGSGGTVLLSAPAGMGKSRLARAVCEEGERRGFLVASGCAYPMESGVPYAVFCDLLDPLVRGEPAEVVAAWTRGAPEFGILLPSLAGDEAGIGSESAADLPDLRNRLLWNLPPFLDRLRRGQPLLLVLEDLEWADPSSLELVHFLGRRSREHGFLLVGTFGTDGEGEGVALVDLARSLEARAGAVLLEPGPLTESDVLEGVSRGFEVDPEVVREFARALHGWTGGIPLFVGAVLETLLTSGRIRREGGRWVGWTFTEPSVPPTLRDLVSRRLDSLTKEGQTVVELAAVAGTRARLDLLREASGMDPSDLHSALRELRDRGILQEDEAGDEVVYAFVHPMVRETLHSRLGVARSRHLHGHLARTLERMYGEGAPAHAAELAGHLVQADGGEVGDAGYLAAAGRQALAGRANAEAARYLEAALQRLPADGDPDPFDLRVDLGRALARLGRVDEAQDQLEQARELAHARSDPARMGEVDRRLGLSMFRAGRLAEAGTFWDRGLAVARTAGDAALEARILIGRCAGLQEEGRAEEAARDALEALRIGEEENDDRIRFAAHRSLLLLHTWTGPPETARRHGREALAMAEATGESFRLFTAHRALAVLEGLTGRLEPTRRHLEEAGRLADELGSPLLKLELAEVWIEYCAGLGHWDRGMDLAEESIRMARELDQRMILPRLLVWSGLLHLDRGDLEIGRAQITEARELAGDGEAKDGRGPASSHLAILVHIGRTALHLASGEYPEALRVGEAGLELIARSGSRIWAIHRLLPIMAEAALHAQELERARAIADRIRWESEAFGHPVGLVWADTCEALVTWLGGDVEGGARRMAEAADRLESIDTVPYAARLRRQVAGRLADLGDRDGAIRELRRVHDIFSTLGAKPELDKVRQQFREVGARPPGRIPAAGGRPPAANILTSREIEIAHLVGLRKSNKAIGKELGVSHRTVGTHLSNIFRKLEVDSRVRLGDLVRAGILDEGTE